MKEASSQKTNAGSWKDYYTKHNPLNGGETGVLKKEKLLYCH